MNRLLCLELAAKANGVGRAPTAKVLEAISDDIFWMQESHPLRATAVISS